MAPSGASENVQRLASAGLLGPESLTEDDLRVIEQLSADEVVMLIQVARRIYPDDHAMLKVQPLNPGSPRILVPL